MDQLRHYTRHPIHVGALHSWQISGRVQTHLLQTKLAQQAKLPSESWGGKRRRDFGPRRWQLLCVSIGGRSLPIPVRPVHFLEPILFPLHCHLSLLRSARILSVCHEHWNHLSNTVCVFQFCLEGRGQKFHFILIDQINQNQQKTRYKCFISKRF